MASDESLHQALLRGDLGAFDELYARYERPLFGFIRHHLREGAEAEDVLHEAFLALLKDRESAGSAKSLKAWLFQVARHLCLNRLRASRRAAFALERDARAPPEPSPEPGNELERQELLAAVRHAVSGLPEALGELYRLRTEGLSYEELSCVLGVPVGTVKSRMHQLVQKLREEMKR